MGPWDSSTDDAPTEVLPFGEFGALGEVPFRYGGAFAFDVDVQFAPELDDLNDRPVEHPLRLLASAAPSTLRVAPRGRHRTVAPEARVSRLLVAAMSGGIAAAVAHGVLNPADEAHAAIGDEAPVPTLQGGIEIISAPTHSIHDEEFARGVAFAAERAAREARLLAPTSVAPTRGILTSGFGYRWGTLHAGLDIANAVGTPIYAAADGRVIAAGPTAGYGMWVKLQHVDGAVTLYGHVDSTTVSVGDWVMAGDQVATMGNRGNSTGPHLHFEVHRSGIDRVDPAAWLRQRGTDLAGVSS